MRKYEAIFILDERQYDDEGKALADDVEKRVKDLGGRMIRKEGLGRKQFARPTHKLDTGLYWDFVFELDSGQVDALKEPYRLNDAVLRSEVLLYDERQEKAREKR